MSEVEEVLRVGRGWVEAHRLVTEAMECLHDLEDRNAPAAEIEYATNVVNDARSTEAMLAFSLRASINALPEPVAP